MYLKTLVTVGALTVTTGAAIADCGAGRLSIVGNEFPAIQTVAKNATACAGLSEAKSNLTAGSPEDQSGRYAGQSGGIYHGHYRQLFNRRADQ